MVKFWDEARKKELSRVTERIKFAERHGIGKMAMDEKKRKQKLEKLIEDAKLK